MKDFSNGKVPEACLQDHPISHPRQITSPHLSLRHVSECPSVIAWTLSIWHAKFTKLEVGTPRAHDWHNNKRIIFKPLHPLLKGDCMEFIGERFRGRWEGEHFIPQITWPVSIALPARVCCINFSSTPPEWRPSCHSIDCRNNRVSRQSYWWATPKPSPDASKIAPKSIL